MKLLNRMTLRKRLIISFTVIMIVFFGTNLLSILTIKESNELYQEAYKKYGSMQGVTGFACAYFYKASEMIMRLADAAPEELNAIAEECKAVLTKSEEYFQLADNTVNDENADKELADIFAAGKTAFYNYRVSIDELLKEPDLKAAVQDSSRMAVLFEQENAAAQKIEALYNSLIDTGNRTISKLDNRMDMAQKFLLGVAVVLLLFILFMEITTIRSLRLTTRLLSKASKRVAEGDIDFELKSISRDEIGRVTEDIAKMIAITRYHTEIVKEIAQGNLNINVEPASPKDSMGIMLKKLVTENSRILGGIQEASGQVNSGSDQVAAASQALAQGSTEQASALEQITASIDDITEKTKINAEDAGTANNLVNSAREDAVLGNDRMNEMIGAMQEINDSSENISKIIKVIDEIAFQTNILALNAAVEAARAGQHGKGFAVVAEEVRSLAGKSAQAASETAEMIEDSIRKVERGSKLAEETATSLKAIVAAIEEVTSLIGAIAAASNDQATAITQIDQALGQVAQVVQSNSATSEECAAASQELSAQAERLREMVGHYRLQSGTGTTSVPEREYETYSVPK